MGSILPAYGIIKNLINSFFLSPEYENYSGLSLTLNMSFFRSVSALLLTLIVFLSSCTNTSKKEKTIPEKSIEKKSNYVKPTATFQDTLFIDIPAAVFYHADSLQLQAIKAKTDEGVFNATMHEYFYQMRNARIVLKKEWPAIKIIEAKNIRYLYFKKKNQEVAIIDLNTKGDPYGLFLFDSNKDPQFTDMMNIDTQLYFYFKK